MLRRTGVMKVSRGTSFEEALSYQLVAAASTFVVFKKVFVLINNSSITYHRMILRLSRSAAALP